MSIRIVFSILFLLASGVLGVYSYENFNKGITHKAQIPTISSEDMSTMVELNTLNQQYELDDLNANTKVLITAMKEILLNVKREENDAVSQYGIDKLGEYRDIIMSGEGDYLSQAYLLTEINDKMRNYVLLQAINATANSITLQVRIYGKSR